MNYYPIQKYSVFDNTSVSVTICLESNYYPTTTAMEFQGAAKYYIKKFFRISTKLKRICLLPLFHLTQSSTEKAPNFIYRVLSLHLHAPDKLAYAGIGKTETCLDSTTVTYIL